MTARKHDDETAAFLKRELLDTIASGSMPSDAARLLRIGWRTLAIWRREDADFRADLLDAEAALADVLASRAVNIHETTTDHRMAMVLSRNLQWGAEKLAPQRYGQKIELTDVNKPGELVTLMRAAIERLELHHAQQAGKLIEHTPTPRGRETPQERHRP